MNTSRERLFAIIAGFVGTLVIGFFVFSWISGQFSTRASDKAKLLDELKKLDRTALQGAVASRKIAQFEERSLPANPEIARTRYQSWLVTEMEACELIEPDVRFMSAAGGDKDLFVRQTFAVDASGTLPQIVKLLHAFYSVDWLHRITRLTLRPVKDSKLLGIGLQIEALSLRKASNTDKLEPHPGNRLMLASGDDYYDIIVGRNLFGPKNTEPKITVSGSTDVFLPREVELTAKFEDPDWLDQVQFELVKSASPDAKLDPITGKFTWKPTEEGSYEFVIQGIDDGFPARRSPELKVVVNAKPQPPPVERAPTFDFAKFTMLSAVLDVDGQGEVWLHVRPTGQMVTLHQGDRFEIGTVKGTVSEIGEFDFSFDFEGKRKKLNRGDTLDQAKPISDVPQVAAPDRPPTNEVQAQAKPADKAS
ncbi:MAG TPA: hypothetical protein VGI40_24440 [Pirellulaceae bacterium]|jgi:hypothetical protein